MPSDAELLGIDLHKLEAERLYHYDAPKPEYVTNYITAPPESSEDWQKMADAAKAVGCAVETIRRWIRADFVMAEIRKRAIYVYMPDVLRHAGKA